MGIVPTRRLLTAALDNPLSSVMVPRVISIPHTATILEACEFFVMHRLLAFPVVDEQQHILGTVDVNMFTDEVFNIAEREKTDEIFEAIGFRLGQVRGAAPSRVFRYRFPWLLATICSSIFCVAPEPRSGSGHRGQRRAFAVLGVPHGSQRADPAARPAPRSQDRRRPADAGPDRHLHPAILPDPRRMAVVRRRIGEASSQSRHANPVVIASASAVYWCSMPQVVPGTILYSTPM